MLAQTSTDEIAEEENVLRGRIELVKNINMYNIKKSICIEYIISHQTL